MNYIDIVKFKERVLVQFWFVDLVQWMARERQWKHGRSDELRRFDCIEKLHISTVSSHLFIVYIQGGPEIMQQLWSLISRTSSTKRNWFLFHYVENSFSKKMTPWSVDHDHQVWVRCLDPSAILVRQCHFQIFLLFRPHRTLEHSNIPTSRRPVRWQSPCFENEDNVNKRSYSLRNSWFSGTPWSEKLLLFQRCLGSKK